MKINFVSFGNELFLNARKRIYQEAHDMKCFDEINVFSEKDIDKSFWKKHENFIKNNKRGYGYWIWKPQIILQVLTKMKDDDILLYCDSGCSLNKEGKQIFDHYIEMTKNHHLGLACFQLSMEHVEKRWNKYSTVEKILGPKFEETYKLIVNTPQCESGMIFIRKTSETINIIREWLFFCEQYDLINDSKSSKTDFKEFSEHRHDQSVWSLLVKKYGGLLIPDETYFYPDWDNFKHFPIHARRWKN